MSQTITVSDAAYANLLSKAQQQGLDSVETLIETTHAPATTLSAEELERRRDSAARADALRERIRATCGVMPDSTPLLREDRER